jgi:hypothetical protein
VSRIGMISCSIVVECDGLLVIVKISTKGLPYDGRGKLQQEVFVRDAAGIGPFSLLAAPDYP